MSLSFSVGPQKNASSLSCLLQTNKSRNAHHQKKKKSLTSNDKTPATSSSNEEIIQKKGKEQV